MEDGSVEYVGFWVRVGASLVDTVLVLALIYPLLIMIYGWGYFDALTDGLVVGKADFLLSYVVPALAVILFWLTKQATPGKMLFGAKVVDARTGQGLTPGQSVGRYLGYYVSMLPLGLGLLWVAFDARKQGWHDKLAGTVVVRAKRPGPRP